MSVKVNSNIGFALQKALHVRRGKLVESFLNPAEQAASISNGLPEIESIGLVLCDCVRYFYGTDRAVDCLSVEAGLNAVPAFLNEGLNESDGDAKLLWSPRQDPFIALECLVKLAQLTVDICEHVLCEPSLIFCLLHDDAIRWILSVVESALGGVVSSRVVVTLTETNV